MNITMLLPVTLPALLHWRVLLFCFAAGLTQTTAAEIPAAVHNNQSAVPTSKHDRVQQLSPELQVEQLAPGLWLHRSEKKLNNGQVFTSNGLILQTGEGIWLLDTAWGYYPTVDLLHWIATVLQQPVVKAIATHGHDDRLGGAAALQQQGIPLYVTEQTARAAPAEFAPLLQVMTKLQPGEKFSDGPLEWFYPGPGHTQDNIVLYLPHYQLLLGGCVLKAPRYPGLGYTGDANLVQWPQSLQRIRQAYPQAKLLVPGHGDVGGPSLLDYSLQLFQPPAAQ